MFSDGRSRAAGVFSDGPGYPGLSLNIPLAGMFSDGFWGALLHGRVYIQLQLSFPMGPSKV